MALTSLGNGVRIPAQMALVGIAGKVACAIVGIPSSRLSLCVSGVQDLQKEDAEALFALLRKLAAIQQAIPFPLSFAKADVWRKILERMDRHNIDVNDIRVALGQIFRNE